MPCNIHVPAVACGLGLAALLSMPQGLRAQGSCPSAAGAVLEAAWRHYHQNAIAQALGEFEQARHLCPENPEAMTGLGFTNLAQGQVARADSFFRAALRQSPNNADAWDGRARAAMRLGDTASAMKAGRRSLTLAPANRELRAYLDRVVPEWNRTPPTRAHPATLQIVARTRGREFQVLDAGGWRDFYVRGVNLGVALPGRYPSEFPADSVRYAGWLDTLSAMRANTLRIYTILDPAFYRALRGWNLAHPDRALWLIHGVWAELPPKQDFKDLKWNADFRTELARVVDVVHGAASIPNRPGHAAGHFDADVSSWVLAYIVGREWEPFAVKAFDARNPISSFSGRFLRVTDAPAMDVWLTEQCDFMLEHEAQTYNALHPIAYTNWPTLDPLRHPTEATTAEEAAWRTRAGRRSLGTKLEYENDAVGLDANLVSATRLNPAGWFASYHAYPYYPDFMFLDPEYRAARSSEGPSSYFGYLRALVEYHGKMPTLISEYGVPSSRGIAHIEPLGQSHGGHDERSMAAIDARLTREIQEAGAAGSILFAWLDEWFKKNWAVVDYEIPADNTRLWHNVMDAEQNYGILGQYAGTEAQTPHLGGAAERWRSLRLLQQGSTASLWVPSALRVGWNESYVFIAAEFAGRERFPWDSLGVQLGIDTYLPDKGQHRLPSSRVHSELGFEFLVDLVEPGRAVLRVTPEYNRYDARLDPTTGDDFGRFARRPVITRDRDDGRFDRLFIITNRARFGRDGAFYRARGYDRGELRFGRESASTLADWYFDQQAGLVELRIPWDLLNVTDPSSRTLLFDDRSAGSFGVVAAGKFHFGLVTYEKRQGNIVGALPRLSGDVWRADSFTAWSWEGWLEPRSHAQLKPVYDSLRLMWQVAPAAEQARLGRKAPSN